MYVNGVQSDLDCMEHRYSEALQVARATSGCEIQENEGLQQQDMFTSVKVECVLEVSCSTVRCCYLIVKDFILKNGNMVCWK